MTAIVSYVHDGGSHMCHGDTKPTQAVPRSHGQRFVVAKTRFRIALFPLGINNVIRRWFKQDKKEGAVVEASAADVCDVAVVIVGGTQCLQGN